MRNVLQIQEYGLPVLIRKQEDHTPGLAKLAGRSAAVFKSMKQL
jgi:hypothetical protein